MYCKQTSVDAKTQTGRPADGCFVAGTLVHTDEGLKPIEEIQVGELVLSKRESGEGERAYKLVTKTFVHEDRHVMMLSVGGDQADGTIRFHNLAVTPEHPFWVQGKGWKKAADIKWKWPALKLELLFSENPDVVGNEPRLFVTDKPDIVWVPQSKDLGRGGRHVDIRNMKMTENIEILGFESVRRTNRVKPEHLYKATVYNIEVDDFHTYYVSEVGVWVHNKNIAVRPRVGGKPIATTSLADTN